MKICKRILTAAVVAALSLGMAACGDDDDDKNDGPDMPDTPGSSTDVNPDKVFTAGVPTQVGDMLISKNAKGQVEKIVDGETIITFEYAVEGGRASRPDDYDMIMRQTDTYENETLVFYIKLKNGFIEYAYEEYERGSESPAEWWFKYNVSGFMTEMKRSEGDNEVTTITYDKAGDITSVSIVDDENKTPSVYNIYYTDASHTSPVANKGCVMLYDSTLGIDMDEMAPAYYAGILGKPTAHLPLDLKGKRMHSIFDWKLNADGMPVSMVARTNWAGDDYWENDDPVVFRW